MKPHLRFPEFDDDSSWDARPLAEYCERLTAAVGDSQLIPVSITAGKGFVAQSEKFGRDISGAQYNKYIRLRRGDFAYNRGNSKRFPQGCVYKLAEFEEAAASNAFYCFRLHDGYEPAFFTGLFENNAHGRQLIGHITSGARGTGLLNISADAFFGIRIPMPKTAAEQNKIADCLSSLEDLIAAEGRKLETLRRHKQGLLQQLIPLPGESVPKLRFPIFNGEPAWSERCFDDLLDSVIDYRGRTPKKLGMEWGGGDIVSLSANNVKNGYIDLGAESHLGSDALYSKWMGEAIVEEGDLVFTMEAPLGNAALVPDSSKYILSQRVVALKTNDTVDNRFLLQLMWSPGFRDKLERHATGSTAQGLSQKALRSLSVRVPGRDEQSHVAECLSPLDDQIITQQMHVELLSSHKRGLLQQLFPSLDGL